MTSNYFTIGVGFHDFLVSVQYNRSGFPMTSNYFTRGVGFRDFLFSAQ
jgi:hypothetical protein